MRPLTKTEFAKERGVSRARVYQWIDDGRIVAIADGEHAGKIDADEAHARLGVMLDQSKGIRREGNVTSSAPAVAENKKNAAPGVAGELPFGQPAGDAGGPREPAASADMAATGVPADGEPTKNDSGYWAHRADREKFDSLLTQARYWKEAGALVPAAGVRREAMEQARALRNALEGIPDRIAAVLDPAHPARAHKLLLDEIRKALHEFSDRLDRRAAAAGAEQPDSVLV